MIHMSLDRWHPLCTSATTLVAIAFVMSPLQLIYHLKIGQSQSVPLGLLVGLCEVAACEVGCGTLGGGADICLTCVIYCTSLHAALFVPTVSSAHAKSEVPGLAWHCSLSSFFVLAYTSLSLSPFLSSRYRLKCSAQGDHGAIDVMLHVRKTQKYRAQKGLSFNLCFYIDTMLMMRVRFFERAHTHTHARVHTTHTPYGTLHAHTPREDRWGNGVCETAYWVAILRVFLSWVLKPQSITSTSS